MLPLITARLRVLTLLLVALVALPLGSFGRMRALPQAPQAQRSKPFPAPQFIPDHDFDTRHIALDLRFDWEKEQLIGRENLSFAPLVDDLRSIQLDAANITVTAVTIASGKSLQFDSEPAKQKLKITLDRAYQPSETLTLVLDYHTNGPGPRGGLTGGGLRFIKPTADDPKRPRQIWSQGESEYNHYWFPCFDHPNDFFTSEITATVERPLTVISNGKLLATTENKDGTRTFHWKIEQPHASYLTSIIIGEYTPLVSDYAGIPIISNVYPNEVAEGKVSTARLPEMVKFFSEKTGLRYPYAKYAQTMVRDFGGGMENISATTQTDNMIHDERTELDQNTDGLQAHELAHQWFGDYVTCRTWADIWLNESFATYFQAMWDEYKLGRDDFLYSDVKANQDSYLNAWRQGSRRPIVTKNYDNPDAVFDTYAYPRGGAVLHMLRKTLGEDNWWRAINYYLHKYANQPVETEQFRIAIEESTGQSMDWFFDEWLYRMGHPIFKLTQEYDDAAKTLKLSVEQLQKIDPDSQYPQIALFRMPVDIEIGTPAGTRIERVQIEPQKEQSFTFKVDAKPLLVNFDFNGTLIKEIQFDKSTAELSYQLSHDPDVLGRIWALSGLAAKLRDQSLAADEKEKVTSDIAQAVTADKFWGLRVEAATALSGLPGDSIRTALIAATKDQNARVRARAVTSLGSSKDQSLAGLYQQLLGDQSYAVVRAAALSLGMTKSPDAYNSLAKLLDQTSWRDTIRASALTGMDALGDKRALESAIKYAGQANYPQVRAASLRLVGHLGKDDPRAFPLISEIIGPAFDRRDFTLGLASAEALVSLGDPRGLAIFEQISKNVQSSPQFYALIRQFQERLKKSTANAGKPPG